MSLKGYYKKDEIDRKISNICSCEYEYFLNKANVIGIGFGYKLKNGFYTCQKCIQVFVSRKLNSTRLSYKDRIPSMYKGILTDVVKKGIFSTSSFTRKIIPAIGGYVIGNEYNKKSSGTFGCLVTDGKDLFILSNNHSMATGNLAPIGTKIIQPSFNYGGDFGRDVIATLEKYIPIKYKSFFKRPSNYVDCAIGKTVSEYAASAGIALIGPPEGEGFPKLNDDVKKVGFVTELTTGKIKSIKSTLEVEFPLGKTAIFKDQILTTKMTEKGDSGAVLLNKKNYIVGLLMGDNDEESIFNPISMVLRELKVRIVIN